MVKFIHTADIHLDSPLKGLEVHENAPVEEIRGATRRAFDNLINLAIEEEVDFILIAGDLYDGDWKDYNTGLFFSDRMGRLAKFCHRYTSIIHIDSSLFFPLTIYHRVLYLNNEKINDKTFFKMGIKTKYP